MAGNKISALTAQSDAIASGDLFVIVDVSDTAQGVAGTTKKATRTQAAAGITAAQVGLKTVEIPAAAMRPTVSNGCAAIADRETTAGRPDMTYLAFDKTADEHAQFSWRFPKAWDLGVIYFRVGWSTLATNTNGVAWGLQAVAVSDGETIDVAYGTPVVVTDDAQAAAEDDLLSDLSAALTIGGTPAAYDRIYFRIFRDVSDANDDIDEDCFLTGVHLYYTVNAANDD